MTNKYIAWILGVALVIILGAFVWLWKSQDKAVLAPGTSDEAANPKKQETSITDGTEKDKSALSASLDDIANNIGSDATDDLSAINDEATAEANLVEEGGNTVNDLGKTYDESQY
jgi:flagellar basal body-associated protein FliL